VTRENVKAAILACRKKLKHVPNLTELTRETKVTSYDVFRNFRSYVRALKECKLEKIGSGMKVEMKSLFHDWARVARALKKIPMSYEYQRRGLYSVRPFSKRFGPWPNVPEAMKLYALEHGLADEWQDVMDLIDAQAKAQAGGPKAAAFPFDAQILTGRPVYGQLLRPFPLICAPVNEFGVVFLFGALAEQLGFQVLRIQGEYPDAEAFRVVAGNRLQRVKIEFEYESRNFLRHGHDARKCDLIVCWENNWPAAPLEVIELKKVLQQSAINQATCNRQLAMSKRKLAANQREARESD
jgi:hypothetical protein